MKIWTDAISFPFFNSRFQKTFSPKLEKRDTCKAAAAGLLCVSEQPGLKEEEEEELEEEEEEEEDRRSVFIPGMILKV